MTVQELIDKLSKMPKQAKVVIRAYEGGVDIVDGVKKTKLIRNPDQEGRDEPAWYYGLYETCDEKGESCVRLEASGVE